MDNWSDPTDVGGVRHTYRVSAVNSAGEGELSKTASDLFVILPGDPLNLEVTPNLSNGTVNLTWSRPDITGGVDLLGYNIYGGLSQDVMELIQSVLNVTIYVDEAKDLGSIHYYSVSAVNMVGEGPRSNIMTVIPQGPPSTPLNARIEVGNGEIGLFWDPPVEDGGSPLLGYYIYFMTTTGDWTEVSYISSSLLYYTHTGLENGVVYLYRIAAVTDIGESPPTPDLEGIPGTIPQAPRYLVAEPSDQEISLAWDPPDGDGGRSITGYIVRFGESVDDMSLSISLGNVTDCILHDLTNGITYFVQVSAVNEFGEGPLCDPLDAMPLGIPGAPTGFTAFVAPAGIELHWSPPSETGGSDSLTYHLLKGTSVDDLEPLISLIGSTSFTDTEAVGHFTFHYRIQAENDMGFGPTVDVNITLKTEPGIVADLLVRPGDGHVLLIWSPPDDDGGRSITAYVILRGESINDLSILVETDPGTSFNDTSARNGRTYFYSVKARNSEGDGVAIAAVSAVPLGKPAPPGDLLLEVVDDNIELKWTAPSVPGTAPVTGFKVYRGTSPGDLEEVATMGIKLSYMDFTVEEGIAYYYQVVALSDMGPGQASTLVSGTIEPEPIETEPFPLWIAMVVVLVVLGAAAAFVVVRRKREPAETTFDTSASDVFVDQEVGASALEVVGVPETDEPQVFIVEQVYVVYLDGRLIVDCARDECRIQDADLMSSMLVAIKGLIQDGLERSGALEGIKFGENNILMATGEHINLAVVTYGPPDPNLMGQMEDLVGSIEQEYAGVLEDWTGELVLLEGVEEMAHKLLDDTMDLSREDVGKVATDEGFSVMSAIGFYRGYVKLDVVAANSTDETVVDAAIELEFDGNLLRLERVEPDTLPRHGDRITLGNIRSGDRKAVTFMFDPQICQGTHVDGTLTYYDPSGEYRHEDIPRRTANVVCPIFFTQENANTAMLRRLIRERLHESDHRVFRYPEGLSPVEVLDLGKDALATEGLQMVREYVSKSGPYEAEVWYYGETKVKGYQMVMRLGVVQKNHVLEVFAASTSMEPVTGFIAEFKRTLDRTVREVYSKDMALNLSHDEALQRSLQSRHLLIERDGWEEDEEIDHQIDDQ
jgi:hypothetical protein